VRAGIERAKAEGKRWGGSQFGRTAKQNAEKAAVILDLAGQGKTIASISRTVGLSRQWIYELIRRDRPSGE
jgi:DNA invertase Pin-like site-specific DNA recombinase